MKTTTVGLIISAFLLSLSFAPAAIACGPGEDQTGCPSTDGPKGNNGWGNGTDEDAAGNGGTNNGSDDGATEVTKIVNGPANDKFEGR
jgi:hypothetical protein